MFQTARKGLGIDPAIIALVSLQALQPNPIDWREGQPESTALVRSHPIVKVGIELTGQVIIASGTTAYDSRGPLRLIDSLEMSFGNEDFVNVSGTDLALIHRFATGGDHYQVNPGTAAGTHDFRAYVEIPLDPGSYAALLDASKKNSLNVKASGGLLADYVTSNAANTTLANVKVQPVSWILDGVAPGNVGGLEGGDTRYYRQHFKVTEKPYSQSGNIEIELTDNQVYNGLILEATNDGARSDALVTEVAIKKQNNVLWKLTHHQIKALNKDAHRLAQAGIVGVYDLPFLLAEHADHMLAVNDRQHMALEITVANPSGANRLRLVEGYYTRGPLRIGG